jgi:FHS family L-fucose permease-like MFS transporter
MQQQPQRSQFISLLLIGFLFFMFGFITWLNGTLIPFLKTACQLNNTQASLVTFAFFISYFVMALPSSFILKKTGFKNGMGLGLLVMAAGCLVFIPAALQRNYNLFLLGLFTQGLGLAILQTASNPYVTIVGPIESAAKRISMMGICNKLAGFISPIILGAILLSNLDDLKNELSTITDSARQTEILDQLAHRIINPYIVLTVVLVLAAIFIRLSPLPEVEDETDNTDAGEMYSHRSLWSHTYLFLGVLSIFAYVGVEVLAGDYIINYGTYLGVPIEYAKYLTSLTLAFMIAGYFTGVFLTPKIMSQETLFRINLVLSLLLVTGVLVTTGKLSFLFLSLLGFTHAIMWPAIWPMSIKGLGRHTKTGSALLIMGIAGGAVIPYLYATLGDKTGNLQQSFWVMIPCYLFMLFFAVKGHTIGYIPPATKKS